MNRRKFLTLTGSAIIPFSGCTSITGSNTKDDEENVQDTAKTTQPPTETPQSVEVRDAYQFTYDSIIETHIFGENKDVANDIVEATVTGEGWFDKRTQEFFIDAEFTRFNHSLPMSYYYDGSVLYRRGWTMGKEDMTDDWLHQEKFRTNLPGGGNVDRHLYKPHQPIPTDFTTEVLPENIQFLYARTDSELQELAQSKQSVLHKPNTGASKTFYYNKEIAGMETGNMSKTKLSYSFKNNELQKATHKLADTLEVESRSERGVYIEVPKLKETFTYSHLNERTVPDV